MTKVRQKVSINQLTKGIKKLKLEPYHKRKCACPFCGRVVIAHKLKRHQKRATCRLARLE